MPREYLPELERARKAREEQLAAVKQESMNRMMKDLELDRTRDPEAAARDQWDPSQNEDEDEDADEDLDVNIIDKSTFPASVSQSHSRSSPGDEHWPGQYIDVTRARRRDDEGVSWPRPG